jgi:hypothetical protein
MSKIEGIFMTSPRDRLSSHTAAPQGTLANRLAQRQCLSKTGVGQMREREKVRQRLGVTVLKSAPGTIEWGMQTNCQVGQHWRYKKRRIRAWPNNGRPLQPSSPTAWPGHARSGTKQKTDGAGEGDHISREIAWSDKKARKTWTVLEF